MHAVYAPPAPFTWTVSRQKNRQKTTVSIETVTLRTHTAVTILAVLSDGPICPHCNLRPRARRRNWSALRNYERSTSGVLEIDPYHDYCTQCRSALSERGDEPAMAVVEAAEADSVRWLIERGRGKQTKAQKAHVCYRCGGAIAVGQRYRRVRGGAARVDVALHEHCHDAEGGSQQQ